MLLPRLLHYSNPLPVASTNESCTHTGGNYLSIDYSLWIWEPCRVHVLQPLLLVQPPHLGLLYDPAYLESHYKLTSWGVIWSTRHQDNFMPKLNTHPLTVSPLESHRSVELLSWPPIHTLSALTLDNWLVPQRKASFLYILRVLSQRQQFVLSTTAWFLVLVCLWLSHPFISTSVLLALIINPLALLVACFHYLLRMCQL